MLFNAAHTQTRFKCWRDIQSIKLIPPLFVNLNDSEKFDVLGRYHWNRLHSECDSPIDILRGFLSGSRLPFLSIRLFNDADWDEQILLVCVFDVHALRVTVRARRWIWHIDSFSIWHLILGTDELTAFTIRELDAVLAHRCVTIPEFRRHTRWVMRMRPLSGAARKRCWQSCTHRLSLNCDDDRCFYVLCVVLGTAAAIGVGV